MDAERKPAIFGRLEARRGERKRLDEEFRQAEEICAQIYNTSNTLLENLEPGFHDFMDFSLESRGDADLNVRFKDQQKDDRADDIEVYISKNPRDKSITIAVEGLGEHIVLMPPSSFDRAQHYLRNPGKLHTKKEPSPSSAVEYRQLVEHISQLVKSHPELQKSPQPAAS